MKRRDLLGLFGGLAAAALVPKAAGTEETLSGSITSITDDGKRVCVTGYDTTTKMATLSESDAKDGPRLYESATKIVDASDRIVAVVDAPPVIRNCTFIGCFLAEHERTLPR